MINRYRFSLRLRLILLLLVIISPIAVVFQVQAQAMNGATPPTQSGQANAQTCQQILSQALSKLHDTCDYLGRNFACYGNDLIQAVAAPNVTLKFNNAGDSVPIRSIRSLVTSPLDVGKGTWGLSLLKLQANLPDTLPGQNVTFLVYGDTSIQNVSGDMQSFYFSSGLGTPDCKDAPQDGIVVRSPNHTEVTFTANGVQITIASTVVLQAAPNKQMTVGLVEGHARVTASGESQVLTPGQAVNVPLGGKNGLEAKGAPSAPTARHADSALPNVLKTVDTVASPDVNVNFTIEGCVTKIDGNTLTISDTPVKFTALDGNLKAAKVGDCFHIAGNQVPDADGSVSVTIVSDFNLAAFDESKAPNAGNDGSNGNAGHGNSGGGPNRVHVNSKGQGHGGGDDDDDDDHHKSDGGKPVADHGGTGGHH